MAGAPAKPLAKLPRERDRDGRRFCRVCDDYLPLAAFPAGQRRYTCRAHLWERVGRPAKRTLLAKPQKRLLSRLWMQCYKDRLVLGHERVELTQADLATLLEAAGARTRGRASSWCCPRTHASRWRRTTPCWRRARRAGRCWRGQGCKTMHLSRMRDPRCRRRAFGPKLMDCADAVLARRGRVLLDRA